MQSELERQDQMFHAVPDVAGQWWHFVSALKDGKQEFGVQATCFMFGGRTMFHGAVVYTLDHDAIEAAGYCQMLATGKCPFTISRREGDYLVRFRFEQRDSVVDLKFTPVDAPQSYPSKDIHWGVPRMAVSGTICDLRRNFYVSGTGCFDREIFYGYGKKLLPGETGWVWTVAWLDDGSTVIDYQYTGEGAREPMHYGPKMKTLTFERIGPEQKWKRGEHLAFSYTEELCRVTGVTADGKPVFGRGYREIVGYDGTPAI